MGSGERGVEITPHAFYKTDANQAEIAAALEKAGYRVINTAMVGNGFPDLLVCTSGGRVVLFEVKMTGGILTPKERVFRNAYPGELYIVRDIETALEYMTHGAMRDIPSHWVEKWD